MYMNTFFSKTKRFAALAILLLGMSPVVMGQDFEEEEEDWSFPVVFAGQRPTITDFVTAILSQEEIGESLGEMKDNWDLYLAGRKLPQGRSILVDSKNGYLRYDTEDKEEDDLVYTSFIEYCYWNCADGRHKLIALNTVCFRNGEPFMGQFSGVSFYMYDGHTRRMDFTSGYDLGLDFDYPEGTEVEVQQLPRVGKTIEYHFYTRSGEVLKKATWDGNKFVVSD